METLELPHRKAVRASIIRDHVISVPSYHGVVCFSCGNAYNELRAAIKHIPVIGISPNGQLTPNKWFSDTDVAQAWPGFFDATSGHLSPYMMNRLADYYRKVLAGTVLDGVVYTVPTGSGETLVALSLAFPHSKFLPQYGVGTGTEYNQEAPLDSYVRVLAGRASPNPKGNNS